MLKDEEKMKNEIIIHIGMPKTGTTSLQKFLALNDDILKQNGYCYPDTRKNFNNVKVEEHGRWANGALDTYEYGKIAHNSIWEQAFSEFNRIVNVAIEKYSVVLSDEGIWNRKHGSDYIRYLRKCYQNVRIIVYLRRQDMWIESANAQTIKRITRPYDVDKKNSCMPLEEYYKNVLKNIEERKIEKNHIFCHYYDRLVEFESIVGNGNLAVYTYEEARKLGLLQHFVRCLKLDYEMFRGIENVNLTPSVMETEVKRRVNFTFSQMSNSTLRLIESIYTNCDMHFEDELRGYRLSSKERHEILDFFAEDNRKVAECYFDRKELFSNEVGYPQTILDEEEVRANYIKTLEKMIANMSHRIKTCQEW